MKALASFVMRGRSQAALVATTSALLSVLIPVIGILAAAVVSLVTLRQGGREGALIALLGTLASGVFFALILHSPWLTMGVLGLMWLPAWGLATVLRISRSLSLTIELIIAFAAVGVALFHLSVSDPALYWQQLFDLMRAAAATSTEVESSALFAELAHWMTGAFAVALIVQFLLSLLLARWWQASLYYPGGFGKEFKALRLHRGFGVLVVLLLAIWPLSSGPGLVADLVLVCGVALFFQGLAVAHQINAWRSSGRGWLILLYILLLLLLPQIALLLVCVGLIDIWADIRTRVAPQESSGRK